MAFCQMDLKGKNIIKGPETLSELYKESLGRCAWLGRQEGCNPNDSGVKNIVLNERE